MKLPITTRKIMSDYTTTGAALRQRIEIIGSLAVADPAIGRPLSRYLDSVESKNRWTLAVQQLAERLEPDCSEPYRLARQITERLDAFESSPGYRRIRLGHRPPDEIERLLAVVLTGPRCAKSIAKAIQRMEF
jgi:hypothetical protein